MSTVSDPPIGTKASGRSPTQPRSGTWTASGFLLGLVGVLLPAMLVASRRAPIIGWAGASDEIGALAAVPTILLGPIILCAASCLMRARVPAGALHRLLSIVVGVAAAVGAVGSAVAVFVVTDLRTEDLLGKEMAILAGLLGVAAWAGFAVLIGRSLYRTADLGRARREDGGNRHRLPLPSALAGLALGATVGLAFTTVASGFVPTSQHDGIRCEFTRPGTLGEQGDIRSAFAHTDGRFTWIVADVTSPSGVRRGAWLEVEPTEEQKSSDELSWIRPWPVYALDPTAAMLSTARPAPPAVLAAIAGAGLDSERVVAALGRCP